MANKLTPNQQEFEKQLRRIKRLMRQAENEGITFMRSPLPERPTHVTRARLDLISRINRQVMQDYQVSKVQAPEDLVRSIGRHKKPDISTPRKHGLADNEYVRKGRHGGGGGKGRPLGSKNKNPLTEEQKQVLRERLAKARQVPRKPLTEEQKQALRNRLAKARQAPRKPLTEEQKQALRERLAKARQSRKPLTEEQKQALRERLAKARQARKPLTEEQKKALRERLKIARRAPRKPRKPLTKEQKKALRERMKKAREARKPLTEEQKQALRERLAKAREAKKAKAEARKKELEGKEIIPDKKTKKKKRRKKKKQLKQKKPSKPVVEETDEEIEIPDEDESTNWGEAEELEQLQYPYEAYKIIDEIIDILDSAGDYADVCELIKEEILGLEMEAKYTLAKRFVSAPDEAKQRALNIAQADFYSSTVFTDADVLLNIIFAGNIPFSVMASLKELEDNYARVQRRRWERIYY